MIGIIDYGLSNLKSVHNAFSYLNHSVKIIDLPSQLKQVDKIILPGVGAFGQAMERINNLGFTNAIKEHVLIKKTPFMGICLGMQLMLDSSTEKGVHKGIGLLKGKVESLETRVKDLPIPHVGWNAVVPLNNYSTYADINKKNTTFYFVHSYYCHLEDRSKVSGQVYYGFMFDVSIESDYVFAFQFHPEKSQHNGLKLLDKFGKL